MMSWRVKHNELSLYSNKKSYMSTKAYLGRVSALLWFTIQGKLPNLEASFLFWGSAAEIVTEAVPYRCAPELIL